MRFYVSYENRRGKTYGAGMKAGAEAHTRGWDAGVRVTVADQNGRDEFKIYMTGGSHDATSPVYLGSVVSTPDGPVFRLSLEPPAPREGM